jgi:co-chaperonin GroES (HSP10)
MPWIPIGHRVLVKPNEVYKVEKDEEGNSYKKQGDLYIPEEVAERESYAWNQGTIMDWGPTAGRHFDGCTMEELGIKRGDKVLYNQYAGLTFKDDNGIGYRVINDQDLNMVWREPEVKPTEEA